jgi:hypothetical protein
MLSRISSMVWLSALIVMCPDRAALRATQRLRADGGSPLALRGAITSVEVETADTRITLAPHLTVTLRNIGARPVILLSASSPGSMPRPAHSEDPGVYTAAPTFSRVDMFETWADASAEWAARAAHQGDRMWEGTHYNPKAVAITDRYPNYQDGPLTGAHTSPWVTLRAALDADLPPLDKVKVLAPGEEWSISVVVGITLDLTPEQARQNVRHIPPAGGGLGRRFSSKSWREITALKTVWCLFECTLWPVNLEYDRKPGEVSPFGAILRERWRQTGILQLEDQWCEPVRLDLPASPQ